jgi:hypothetical protein
MFKRETGRPFGEALSELVASFDGAERDFVDRVCRVLVEELHKFERVGLNASPADGAVEAKRAVPEASKLMEALVIAARERDADKLAIIEHAVSYPFDWRTWG